MVRLLSAMGVSDTFSDSCISVKASASDLASTALEALKLRDDDNHNDAHGLNHNSHITWTQEQYKLLQVVTFL
jgi:hypothetical protein